MKRFLFIMIIVCLPAFLSAQPKARRQQQEQKKQTSSVKLTQRALSEFPTAEIMPDNVVWRRDIYRELDLSKDENAGLYYPVEPQGKQMNLFTYLFKLALAGYINIYEYRLDGNESFEESAKTNVKDLLSNYHIFYEEKNGKVVVDNSDIPSSEVKAYYIKETSYYDQSVAEFRTQVLALCPIMTREDDFGDGAAKYPLFWVKYSEIAPYLSRLTTMTSNLNNAATMTLDDFFTLNKYNGKIYKTNNMLGQTLAQYCPTDSAMAKEQKKIEAELVAFEKNVWGDQAKKDSLDSIANTAKDKKSVKASKSKRRSSSSSKVSKKSKSTTTTSSSSAARVSVRRQRH